MPSPLAALNGAKLQVLNLFRLVFISVCKAKRGENCVMTYALRVGGITILVNFRGYIRFLAVTITADLVF
jgi:hypothetical protein